MSTPRKGAPAAAPSASKGGPEARPSAAKAKAPGAGRTAKAGSSGKARPAKGRAVPAPPGPGLVVGQVPLLARIAGALGLLGAVVRFAAVFPALATTDNPDVGDSLGGIGSVFDLVPPLPILLVVGGAGLLAARGRLPRLGLAVLLAAGTLAAGLLLSTLALFATGSHSTVDLPLGIATSARYEPGAGLVLLAVAYGLLTAAAVAAGLAWSTTVMEDDGSYDPQRPRIATWGLIVGCATALAYGMSPYGSSLGLDPGTVPERAGPALAGGLVLTLGAAVWAVVAATLRPRLAVAGAYAGLAAVLAAETLAVFLLAIRSPAVETTAGTFGQLVAVLAVTALAVAAAGRNRGAAG